MSEKYEVEFRALITPQIFESLLEKGRKDFSETFSGPLIIQDSYFCPKSVTGFKEIEMDKVGSFSLRLRREEKNNETEISLNTKTIKNEKDHNAWVEHEVSVSSYSEGSEILKTIGFKNFFEFTKKRYQFSDGDIHICLEDIENFGQAIEIEVLTTEDNVDEAKNGILEYLHTYGIEKEMLVEKSITNLLMKKLSNFSN